MENNFDIFSFIITMIIGLIIGIVIGYTTIGNIKYVGPNSNEIKKKIYKDANGKKFSYFPEICICPSYYSMDKLHDNNFKEHHD